MLSLVENCSCWVLIRNWISVILETCCYCSWYSTGAGQLPSLSNYLTERVFEQAIMQLQSVFEAISVVSMKHNMKGLFFPTLKMQILFTKYVFLKKSWQGQISARWNWYFWPSPCFKLEQTDIVYRASSHIHFTAQDMTLKWKAGYSGTHLHSIITYI